MNGGADNGLRIGFYVCHCGHNIASMVDCAEVARYVGALPGVALSRDYKYMCSDPGQELIQQDIREHRLNRVVVASCSPLLHERTFPLLAPETGFSDPTIERAALAVLRRENQALSDLAVPGTPEIHFEPEERPILVFPGRLAVGEARRDELNRDRLRVNVAFTLPPGCRPDRGR